MKPIETTIVNHSLEGLAARMRKAVDVQMALKGVKSYAELGRLAGPHWRTCSSDLGESTTMRTLGLIAEALGCDPRDLMGSA